jgi:hypothetical protein
MPIEAPPMSHRNFWLPQENKDLERLSQGTMVIIRRLLSIAGNRIEAF